MTPVVRLADWRPRLVAYVNQVHAQPFAYGSHDCALFAAGAVEAMTGTDLAAKYRGRYTSLKEGLKLSRGQHLAVLKSTFEEIPTAFAGVGDIAMIGEVGFPALGIFDGELVLVLREEGLGLMPRAAATKAYRVR